MNKPLPPKAQQRLHMLYRYVQALEYGDLERIVSLLRAAEQDAALDRMFQEIDMLYQVQHQMVVQPHELAALHDLIAHLHTRETENIQAQQGSKQTKANQTHPIFPLQQERRQPAMQPHPMLFTPERKERGLPQAQPSQKKRFTRFLQMLAAVLVLSVLVGSFLLLSRLPHSGSQHGNPPASAWRTVPMPRFSQESSLNALIAISQSDAWAVGTNAIYHWNGQQWQFTGGLFPLHNFILFSIAATSAHDVWTVGAYEDESVPGRRMRPLLAHWNGQQWTTISSDHFPVLGEMNAVAALSPNNVWAIGYSISARDDSELPLILHWDGHQWSVVPPSERSGTFNSQFRAISALSPDDIWVAGNDSYMHPGKPQTTVTETLAEHWDGTTWKIVPGPSTGLNDGFTSIAALSPTNIWAITSGSTEFPPGSTDQGTATDTIGLSPNGQIEHWDGKTWQIVQPAPHTIPSGGIAAISANDIWATGSTIDQSGLTTGNALLHWNGQQWNSVSFPERADSSSPLALVAHIPGTQKVWLTWTIPGEMLIGPE